ncbi:dTDP-4-amino-4,6-dideoxygalactose transaminase [Stakelama sediminis]|uniref:dTDP-4-amino-4,6-dideoxygalactose transaminase n=2 Tax=Stakelama sediminis TaxID=463200 RepID=A0A840Z0P7_9SPHN|nr:DegT/DnrJ/EryC1/StrS family aminotransferase [Stakelama sediminis]MBB5719485.1 dTDP-4-amino-4,6-dideoxygalactose transaminase [Stakelama sediminis]
MELLSDRQIPLIAPNPPKLSEMGEELAAIEASGQYSNAGPTVSAFERAIVEQLFGGEGACLAVANATLGLMIAIRQAAGRNWRGERFALIPAFTFAATAHAAEWAGLTPLLIDSDPDDWAACAEAEDAAFARYGSQIAVVVPYATFGTCIDLERYRRLAERHDVGVVIDAAASLGALDENGHGFGQGHRFATVFSMHATKPFATAEGGLVYSADPACIDDLRAMTNFGFGMPRTATVAGLNAKLSEVSGLLASRKLAEIDSCADHRTRLGRAYGELLGDFRLQRLRGARPMTQFQSLLLPSHLAAFREDIIAGLAARGVGAAHYFAPHLGQQPYFKATARIEPTPVADSIAARILSLPLHDHMDVEDVRYICEMLFDSCAKTTSDKTMAATVSQPERTGTLIIGGGPGGMAVLNAAAKGGRLETLARSGLTMIDRDTVLGSGQLGTYSITSDSTAQTFLSAAKDTPYPAIEALVDSPGGRTIAHYNDALGVPLAETPPFLNALAASFTTIAQNAGAQVVTGYTVTGARQVASGGWRVQARMANGTREREWLAERIVIATGGYQDRESIGRECVDGAPLIELAGDRLMTGDMALRSGAMSEIRARLADAAAPRIAVIGGSTSALASIAMLLKASPALPLGANAVTLLHRQPLRPFYPSVEAAHADGFTDFGPDDICPVSGFVYRLAGFRLESRELVLRMLRVGGRVPDPRLTMHQVQPDDPQARRIVEQADLVIGALGYRPHALPLFDTDGNRIALCADLPGRPRLVDQQCRVIDADGTPVPDAFGIGLAAGFVPEGRLGGEPSFRGKANGLWLWQNDVGMMVVDHLLKGLVREAA